LVHPKDHKHYAARILELLDNPQMKREFGAAARKKVVAKFSMEVVAQQSVLFYKKWMESK
jgi:glycosyltransferase involved in cell wall biosynthesis